jgi:sugar/nucleoside kinase (ribokinase family)
VTGRLCRGTSTEGIETLLPPRTERDTGFVVYLVDAEGERTFVTSPGAEATLTPADLQTRPAGRPRPGWSH